MNVSNSSKLYLSILFGGVVAAMAFSITVVSIVDPRGYFCTYESSSINEKRYYAISDRFSRSVRLKYGDFQTIYFGGSRTKTGLPTDIDRFNNTRTYNAGLLATNMYEMKEVIDFSLEYQAPDTVLYAVNFSEFTSRRTTNADYDSSLFASEWNLIPSFARYLLSLDSLINAAKTLRANIQGYPPGDTDDIHNCDGTRTVLRISGQQEIFEASIARMYRKIGIYNCYDYSADRLARFRSSLIALLESGASVALYIPPIHAYQMVGIESASLLPTFNQWRHDISDIVAELRHDPKLGDRLIAAWDFSLPVGVNTETVPLRPDELMVGYYDSGHHTPRIGTDVINSLMEDRLVNDQLEGYELGVASSNANIEQLQAQLDRYKETHPQVVAKINGIRDRYRLNTACEVSQ